MRLATRIRLARQFAKVSQEELGMKLGVSRGAVANWECADDARPASERLERIALATRVSYEWLATGRGRMVYQPDLDETLTLDVDMVEDPAERRLLQAFRNVPTRIKLLILEMAESHAPHAPRHAKPPSQIKRR